LINGEKSWLVLPATNAEDGGKFYNLYRTALTAAMAVTIMFGLAFATVLTLMVVPVLYAIFYKVPNPVR